MTIKLPYLLHPTHYPQTLPLNPTCHEFLLFLSSCAYLLTSPPYSCVNCVWDLYRESLEFYTEQKLRAQQALGLLKQKSPLSTPTSTLPNQKLATSIDGDGVALRIDEREWLDNEDIPVGIRAFMATEKRLRERKRAREEGRAM